MNQHGGLTRIDVLRLRDRSGKPIFRVPTLPNQQFGQGHCQCGGNIFSDIGNYFSDVASDPLRAGLALGTFGISEATGLGANLRGDPLRALAAASTGGITELGLAGSRAVERATGMKGTALLDKATPALASILGPEVAVPIKVISTVGKQLGGRKRRRKTTRTKRRRTKRR